MLGLALTGTQSILGAEASIASTCKDGINNDGDQDGIAPLIVDIDDAQDPECVWMPFKFGQGEYDGFGGNPPDMNDVAAYATTWNTIDNYPTYFEALVELGQVGGRANVECSQSSVDAMIEYRDTFGIPDSKTGSQAHQAHCGISY